LSNNASRRSRVLTPRSSSRTSKFVFNSIVFCFFFLKSQLPLTAAEVLTSDPPVQLSTRQEGLDRVLDDFLRERLLRV
jgi:hypothetical protein